MEEFPELNGSNEISSSIMEVPSYLEPFLEKEKITFHHKTVIEEEETRSLTPPPPSTPLDEEDTTNSCLTGKPLEVDLSASVTVTFENMPMPKTAPQWQNVDLNYGPIPIETARKILSKFSKEPNGLPTYCLIDGNNSAQTVLMGMKKQEEKVITILLNNLKLNGPDDEKTKISWITKQHLTTIFPYKQVTIKETNIYKIYGQNFANYSDYNSYTFNGCITAEAEPTFSSVILNFKVAVGHPSASCYWLWQELDMLSQYNQILKKHNIEGTDTLSTKSFSQKEYIDSLKYVLLPDGYKVKTSLLEELENNNVNCSNATEIDLIWEILKRCPNVKMLSECILFIRRIPSDKLIRTGTPQDFREFIEELRNLDMPYDDLSQSAKEGLNTLFKLGSKKLYQKYLSYVKVYANNSKFEYDWDKIKTFDDQLLFLNKMHLIVEVFEMLVQNLPAATSRVYTRIHDKIIDNILKFNNGALNEQLYSSTVTMPSFSGSIDKDLLAMRIVTLTSSIQTESFQFETRFAFSSKPLLPPTVYKYSEEDNYFGIYMLRITEA